MEWRDGPLDPTPRVDVTFTLAATKAADIGFALDLTGAPSHEQIDEAVSAAEYAMQQGLGVRKALMLRRDRDNAEVAAAAAPQPPQETAPRGK